MTNLLHLFLLLLLRSGFSSGGPLYHSCGSSNYTSNSNYKSNLNQLLRILTSTNSSFTTNTTGSTPNTAYGLFLCRGDVGLSYCRVCIQNAVKDIPSLCPSSKQATVWYDNCELRYSNLRFFSSLDYDGSYFLANPKNVTDNVQGFIRLQTELLDDITSYAAYNSSTMFATGTAMNGSGASFTLSALAQCTRDLSPEECGQCLLVARAMYTGSEESSGGRILTKSCNFRYEMYGFYQGKPDLLLNLTTPVKTRTPPPAPETQVPAREGSKNNTKKVLSITIPIVVVVMLLVTICIYFWKKRATKLTLGKHRAKSGKTNLEDDLLLLDLSTLKVATDNFSEANKLGEGGFGSVYKGKLADGQEIAVKRLSTSSTQGVEELKTEILLVAKLQHRNLVKLLGGCLEEQEKLLVYEYVPNRSLDNLLFDPVKCKLNWGERFNIIGGIARGLFYLHEESHLNAIHRDLKASNILLDTDMTAKISDFGLARLFGGDETQGTTSRVVGTFGYMAPEYALHGHFSTKVDVYSYGVLVLEIVTAKMCSKFYDSERAEDFLSYVWEHWSNGQILQIVDPSLETFSKNEILRCIHIALLCVQEVPDERPSISSVVIMLHSPSVPLKTPTQPRFARGMISSSMSPKSTDVGSSDECARMPLPISVNDVSITEMQPR